MEKTEELIKRLREVATFCHVHGMPGFVDVLMAAAQRLESLSQVTEEEIEAATDVIIAMMSKQLFIARRHYAELARAALEAARKLRDER